ncbi:glycosyltransferase family 2 protein [Cohnella sp. JJ-181]|uniref:glycosyltransferase family 2 protein n=1 Tax=Cohnella rhizoplanae TaxID=2974897 RepID=UPI0022FF7C59|nr:glycosyltransferase [Cohnella sp. JJ-181]CAI6042910.1 hypothetical protein COHCIP112018_01158 [Cohnella sp. JJ-181]
MDRTTVVIPSYNGSAGLRDCVNAVRADADGPVEVIAVAVGRTPDTAVWCGRDGIACIALSAEIGVVEACNKGMRLATSDRIVVLGEEWLVLPGWLAALNEALGAGNRGGLAWMPDPGDGDGRDSKTPAEARIGEACIAVRRRAIDRIGLLDPRYRSIAWAFADYALRARLYGCEPRLTETRIVRRSGTPSHARGDARPGEEALDRQTFAEKWSLDSLALI